MRYLATLTLIALLACLPTSTLAGGHRGGGVSFSAHVGGGHGAGFGFGGAHRGVNVNVGLGGYNQGFGFAGGYGGVSNFGFGGGYSGVSNFGYRQTTVVNVPPQIVNLPPPVIYNAPPQIVNLPPQVNYSAQTFAADPCPSGACQAQTQAQFGAYGGGIQTFRRVIVPRQQQFQFSVGSGY